MAATTTSSTSVTALFSRAIQVNEADLSPETAQAILKFAFPPSDCARMNELAEKNQYGRGLTPEEETELNNYLSVGRALGVLHSKARRSLKKASGN